MKHIPKFHVPLKLQNVAFPHYNSTDEIRFENYFGKIGLSCLSISVKMKIFNYPNTLKPACGSPLELSWLLSEFRMDLTRAESFHYFVISFRNEIPSLVQSLFWYSSQPWIETPSTAFCAIKQRLLDPKNVRIRSNWIICINANCLNRFNAYQFPWNKSSNQYRIEEHRL